MDSWASDFVITVSIIISGLTVNILAKKLKWGWKLLLTLAVAIILSTIGHLIIKFCQ